MDYGYEKEQSEQSNSTSLVSLVTRAKELLVQSPETHLTQLNVEEIAQDVEPRDRYSFFRKYVLDPELLIEEAAELHQQGFLPFDDTPEGIANREALEILFVSTMNDVESTIVDAVTNGVVINRDELSDTSRLMKGMALDGFAIPAELEELKLDIELVYRTRIEDIITRNLNYTSAKEDVKVRPRNSKCEMFYNLLHAAWMTETPEVARLVDSIGRQYISTALLDDYMRSLLTPSIDIISVIEDAYKGLYERQKKLSESKANITQSAAAEIGLTEAEITHAFVKDQRFYRNLLRGIVKGSVKEPGKRGKILEIKESDKLLEAVQQLERPEFILFHGFLLHYAQLNSLYRSTNFQMPSIIGEQSTSAVQIVGRYLHLNTRPGLNNLLLDSNLMLNQRVSRSVKVNYIRNDGDSNINAIRTTGVDPFGAEFISPRDQVQGITEHAIFYMYPRAPLTSEAEIWERRSEIRRLKDLVQKTATLSISPEGNIISGRRNNELANAGISSIRLDNAVDLSNNLEDGYIARVRVEDDKRKLDIELTFYITTDGRLYSLNTNGDNHEIIPLTSAKSNYEPLELLLWKAIASRRIEPEVDKQKREQKSGRKVEKHIHGATINPLGPGRNRAVHRVRASEASITDLTPLQREIDKILQDPMLSRYKHRNAEDVYLLIEHLVQDEIVKGNLEVEDLFYYADGYVYIDSLLLKLVMYKGSNFSYKQISIKEAQDPARKYQLFIGYSRGYSPEDRKKKPPTEVEVRSV